MSTEFCQENALVIANTFFNNTRDDFTHGHYQMVNIKVKLITFFVAENAEAVYSQQKQTNKRPRADCGIERKGNH